MVKRSKGRVHRPDNRTIVGVGQCKVYGSR